MMLAAERAALLSPERLHLILMPTEACQFRCRYCYEDFRVGRMKEDVVRGVESLIARRLPDLRHLEISWFGGEPLLAVESIRRIMRGVRDGLSGRPDCAFGSEMTTNGYRLDAPLLEELTALGIRHYQVSFDGDADIHDARRLTAAGGGTFARLWANLVAWKSSDSPATFLLRLHLTPDNLDSCRRFVVRAGALLEGDTRFRLFPKLLGRWGSPNDGTLSFFDRETGQPALRSIRDLARRIGMAIAESGGEQPCYAARGNSFVIRADGRVNKCTLALEAPENQVGQLTSDGRLVLEAAKVAPWMRGVWENSAALLQCPKIGLVPEAAGAG